MIITGIRRTCSACFQAGRSPFIGTPDWAKAAHVSLVARGDLGRRERVVLCVAHRALCKAGRSGGSAPGGHAFLRDHVSESLREPSSDADGRELRHDGGHRGDACSEPRRGHRPAPGPARRMARRLRPRPARAGWISRWISHGKRGRWFPRLFIVPAAASSPCAIAGRPSPWACLPVQS